MQDNDKRNISGLVKHKINSSEKNSESAEILVTEIGKKNFFTAFFLFMAHFFAL